MSAPDAPTLALSRPPGWMAEALCAQVDPDLFYPERGGSTREAKQVCAACPVRTPCLAYALAHGERFGIWGGVSERDRRRLQPPAPLAERGTGHRAGAA